MKDYSDIGIGPRMVKATSLAGTRAYVNALEENLKVESTPYLNRTAIGKGTLQTTLGGLVEFYDTTGGTRVLTYNPDTGVVTILGSLVAQQVSTGTYTSITIAGTSTVVGTITNGVYNNVTIGTPNITGGTVTSSVLNSNTIGTPNITGGSHKSAVFGTPTLQTPTIDGTPNLDVNAGSPALNINGDFAIETHTGSAILVARVGGTSFYFTSAGTLA